MTPYFQATSLMMMILTVGLHMPRIMPFESAVMLMLLASGFGVLGVANKNS